MTNIWDIVSSIGTTIGAIGGVTGIIALFQTRNGNKLAKSANGLAEEANGISREANALASDANKKSADANLIANRALNVTSDNLVYNWRLKFDHERVSVVVINDCANTAYDVSVTILAEGRTVVDDRIDQVPAFGEIALRSELLLEKTIECERQRLADNASGGFFDPGPVPYGIRAFIVWTSELGKRSSHCIQQGIY